jgi:DNA-binding NtrC family response regulator
MNPLTHPRQKSNVTSAASRTVLVACVDPEIRDALADALRSFSIRTVWVKKIEDAKHSLATDSIAICLCGFWLAGGTCRDLCESVSGQATEIPVIIASASAPAFASQYQHYLAALNIGAFDFICRPYRPAEFQKILELALKAHSQSLSYPPVRLPVHTSSFHIEGPGLSH